MCDCDKRLCDDLEHLALTKKSWFQAAAGKNGQKIVKFFAYNADVIVITVIRARGLIKVHITVPLSTHLLIS
jgi:hypothetical protein